MHFAPGPKFLETAQVWKLKTKSVRRPAQLGCSPGHLSPTFFPGPDNSRAGRPSRPLGLCLCRLSASLSPSPPAPGGRPPLALSYRVPLPAASGCSAGESPRGSAARWPLGPSGAGVAAVLGGRTGPGPQARPRGGQRRAAAGAWGRQQACREQPAVWHGRPSAGSKVHFNDYQVMLL